MFINYLELYFQGRRNTDGKAIEQNLRNDIIVTSNVTWVEIVSLCAKSGFEHGEGCMYVEIIPCPT